MSTRSTRYKNQVGKSPGRVDSGKRLHERNQASMGGRLPKHGRRMVAELVKRGEQLDGPLGDLTRNLEAQYSVDYGGDLSTAERALVKRMVVLDVDLALCIAERDRAARWTKADAMNHRQDVNRNCAAFSALVKVMGGPGRRQKPADADWTLRDFSAPGTEQKGAS